MSLTPLIDAAAVLAATAGDPFARGSLRHPVVHGWSGHGAHCWLSSPAADQPGQLSALGAPAAVAALLGALQAVLPDGQQVTLPRLTAGLLPAGLSLRGTDWDFRHLAAAPPVHPAEHRVGPAPAPLVAALLAQANPTASVQPGDPTARRWVGVRAGDRLLACAADTSSALGVGHLSAIAVHPQARGQGLGGAVTSHLTRLLLSGGCDVVTLGMYAHNTAGRALYDSLGFADDHRFTSGPLRVQR